jgi:lipopolysaccharide export system protein LptA
MSHRPALIPAPLPLRGRGAIEHGRLALARAMLLVAFALCAATGARAERADRAKPMQIDADHQTLDDLNQVSVFTGAVALTKGTLHLTGQRVEYREDPEGYQYAVVTAPPGQRATFRERRDATTPGVEETIGGEADRIEYDGKLDTVRLITNAVVRRFANGVQRDQITGSLIIYDGLNSTYDVRNDGGDAGHGSGRVQSILSPRLAPTTSPAGVPIAPAVPPALRESNP